YFLRAALRIDMNHGNEHESVLRVSALRRGESDRKPAATVRELRLRHRRSSFEETGPEGERAGWQPGNGRSKGHEQARRSCRGPDDRGRIVSGAFTVPLPALSAA